MVRKHSGVNNPKLGTPPLTQQPPPSGGGGGTTNPVYLPQVSDPFLTILKDRLAKCWAKQWKTLFIFTAPDDANAAYVHSPDWDILAAASSGGPNANNITAIANTTPVQITINATCTWATGDTYTIAGCPISALNGTQTITRISDTVASINGSTAGGAFSTGNIGTISTTSTTTEGMGYAMLMAVDQNDKVTFDKLWKYINGRMNYMNLSLSHWRWDVINNHTMGKVGQFPVATDGDEDIIWALVLANEINGWGTSYTLAGMRMAQDLYRYGMITFAGKKLLATANIANNNPASNLSYFPDYPRFALFEKLSVIDPVNSAGWNRAITDNYTVKNDASHNLCSDRFVPDSCLVQPSYAVITASNSNHTTEASRSIVEDLFGFTIENLSSSYNHVLTRSKYLRDYAVLTAPNSNNTNYPTTFNSDGTVGSGAGSYRLSFEALAASFSLYKNAEVYPLYNRLIANAWSDTLGTWLSVGSSTASNNYFSIAIYCLILMAMKAIPTTPVTGFWSSLVTPDWTSATPYGDIAVGPGAGLALHFNADTAAVIDTGSTGQNNDTQSSTAYARLGCLNNANYNFAQTTSSKQPAYNATGIGGKPAMSFDYTASQSMDMAITGLGIVNNTGGIFVSMVLKSITGSSGNYTLLYIKNSAAGTVINWYIDKTNLNYNLFGRRLTADPSFTVGTPNNVHVHNTATIVSLWIDYINGIIRMFKDGYCILEYGQVFCEGNVTIGQTSVPMYQTSNQPFPITSGHNVRGAGIPANASATISGSTVTLSSAALATHNPTLLQFGPISCDFLTGFDPNPAQTIRIGADASSGLYNGFIADPTFVFNAVAPKPGPNLNYGGWLSALQGAVEQPLAAKFGITM